MRASLKPRSIYDVFAVIGCVAALGGSTAYAANTVFSDDIVNGEVFSVDIADNRVASNDVRNDDLRSIDILDESLAAVDIGASAVGQSEIATDGVGAAEVTNNSIDGGEIVDSSLGAVELGSSSVGSSELATGAVTNGKLADGSVQSDEVSDDSLSGVDINESTLGPSLDVVHNAGSDAEFGPAIGTNLTNVLTDNLNAGTWVVYAEVGVENHGDDNTLVLCGIKTDGTRREEVSKHLEAFLDDSGWDDNLPMTAVFTTSSPTTLRLACQHSFGTTDVRTRSADLVAIPVASVG